MKKEITQDLLDLCMKYKDEDSLEDFCKHVIHVLTMVILKKSSENETRNFILNCLSHTIKCFRQLHDERKEQMMEELGPLYDAASVVIRVDI